MSHSMMRSLGGLLLGLMVGCATPSATTSTRTQADQPEAPPPPSPPPDRAAPPVVVNARAKLLFDDAVKALDAQRKAKSIDYASLEKKFRAAADADPALAEATYNLGVLAERQGRTREAASLYREALSRKPSLHQAAENLAVIAQNEGDEKGAMAIYQDLSTSYPDDGGSRARLAEIHRRRGENDQALELARAALFRDPKSLQAYKTMMLVYLEQKQYSLARLIALRASKLDDSDPEVFQALGLICLAEKDPAKARVQFKKAVAARPDFLPARYELARMAFADEDYQGAAEHLGKILQANGNNPQALLDLGIAYKGVGQLDKAMSTYDEVQRLNPDLPELAINRGIIVGLKGDPERAISLFKTYIARRGGETSVPADHPVYGLIEEQERAIKQREDDKKLAEEAKRMEEEIKKQEAAADAEEKRKKDEDLQKQQAAAKGKGGGPKAVGNTPAEGDGAAKDEAPPKSDPRRKQRPGGPKKEPKAGDEPSDNL